jgi:hypothetical protein
MERSSPGFSPKRQGGPRRRARTATRYWQRLCFITGLSLVTGLLLTGCQGEKTDGPTAQKPAAATASPPVPKSIEKKYERGPFTFFVKADKEEMTIAEKLHLSLEAIVSDKEVEAYDIEFPAFGEKLLEFGIVDVKSPLPRLTGDGKLVYQKSCELEPFLSGEYKIPSFKISYWKKGEKAQGNVHELETEELTVKVNSILPEKLAELAIKDVTEPVQPPAPFPYGWMLAGAVVLLLAGGVAGYFFWWKKRKRAAPLMKVPAHELAYAALEKLLADKLIEKGEIKLFYIRLSDIFRHYIEYRFGLHAPEQTTEEFLATAQTTALFLAEQKTQLKQFLVHCDMVKFAELQPTNQDIQQTFDICRNFIQATASKTPEHSAPSAEHANPPNNKQSNGIQGESA